MPNDPLVLDALARMYVDAGNQGEAVRLYERILSRSPNDLDTLRAAGAPHPPLATSARRSACSSAHSRSLQIYRQTLAALGNIYRRQGRDSKALPLLRQAEARLQQQLTGGTEGTRAAALRARQHCRDRHSRRQPLRHVGEAQQAPAR